MSTTYHAVGWTPFKKRYDIVLALAIVGYLAAFVLVSKIVRGGDESLSD